MVRLRAHCVIHHHLKNQVSPTLQIQAEVDAVEKRRFESGSAKQLGAQHAINKNQKNGDDDSGF